MQITICTVECLVMMVTCVLIFAVQVSIEIIVSIIIIIITIAGSLRESPSPLTYTVSEILITVEFNQIFSFLIPEMQIPQ